MHEIVLGVLAQIPAREADAAVHALAVPGGHEHHQALDLSSGYALKRPDHERVVLGRRLIGEPARGLCSTPGSSSGSAADASRRALWLSRSSARCSGPRPTLRACASARLLWQYWLRARSPPGLRVSRPAPLR